MPKAPYLRLLEVLSGSSQGELRRQIQYLKAENEILRAHIDGPVRVTARERYRLVRLARPLGAAVKGLVNIVKPGTFMRWIKATDTKRKPKPTTRRPGRPRTPDEIRQIILRIARETGWGYTRILGELKKLDIHVSRSTVVNILRQASLPTGPERGEATWDQFIRSHAETLWACDFVQQRVLTLKGWKDAYLLVFVNVATRRAIATTSTEHPDARWVAKQAATLQDVTGESGCRVLTRDSDTKFGKAFDEALKGQGITPVRLPHCSPNLNAHAERFIQTLQNECLNRFIVMGSGHINHLTSEYLQHYNTERPHSGIGYRVPGWKDRPLRLPNRDGEVRCRTRLGGVLRNYERAAG